MAEHGLQQHTNVGLGVALIIQTVVLVERVQNVGQVRREQQDRRV